MSSYFGQGGSFRKNKQREEVDPMLSMSNIGDVMLVFACGLMCALVTAWSVDLATVQEIEKKEEVDASQMSEMAENLYGDGSSFVERGTVYQDPTTGKYYLVEPNGESK